MIYSKQIDKVSYPDINAGGQPLVVERVRYGREILVARGVQRLLREAYERHLEVPKGLLPTGAIREHLANETKAARIVRQAARMRRAMDDDSRYWVIRNPDESGLLLALAKTSPGEGGGVYINDILSADEGHGYGSAALDAALRFDGYDQNAPVSLDGFAGSTVNTWFENMGLKKVEYDEGTFAVGPHKLDQIAYAGAAVCDLTGYMLAHHPELASAVAV